MILSSSNGTVLFWRKKVMFQSLMEEMEQPPLVWEQMGRRVSLVEPMGQIQALEQRVHRALGRVGQRGDQALALMV